ncbi:MAG: hypothetical protein ACO3FI_02855 [Cyclobacteriaceae bacterium]
MMFDEYLKSKKIDSEAFQKNEPETFSNWKALFEQMHPASFTSRFLFKINGIRRKYMLQVETTTMTPAAVKPKQVIRPKIS